MAQVVPLQNTWHQGMKRDVSRDRMPDSTLWNAVDVISNYGGPLRERGGWVNHSQAISSVSSTASYVRAGVYCTFATSGGSESSQNLALDEDGHLYNVTTASSATSIGAALTVLQNPVFHGGAAASAATAFYTGLVIIPDGTGAAGPKKYDGVTLSNLGGTPPKAKYAAVYKDYTVLGNGSVSSTYFPNRIWFSPEGDPDAGFSSVTAWDTTDSWIDMNNAVRGIASTKNALMVFHDSSVTRIRGSVPPPDEDMVVDRDFFDVGLTDPFSIANHHDTIVWAAPEGLFRTDGAILDDVTRRGGMLRYWTDLTASATSSWTFAGAVLRDTYFLSVMDGSTFKDAFMIDLLTLSWTRLSNVKSAAMWSGQLNNAADELYWGRRDAAYVCRMSTVFTVGNSTYKNDGNGTAVVAVVETPYYPAAKAPGPKRIRRVFITHDLTDYNADNPEVTLEYVLTPEETSYSLLADNLTETSAMSRVVRPVQRQAEGIAFKLSRANAGDFSLHALEVEAWPYEQSRRIS